jgi:hypothetical protein
VIRLPFVKPLEADERVFKPFQAEQNNRVAVDGGPVERVQRERLFEAGDGLDRPLQERENVGKPHPYFDVIRLLPRGLGEGLQRLLMQPLLLQRGAEAEQITGVWISLVGTADPLDGRIILPGLQRKQAHELKRVHTSGIELENAPAAKLHIQMTPGLHVLDSSLVERGDGARAGVVTCSRQLGAHGLLSAIAGRSPQQPLDDSPSPGKPPGP